MRVTHEKHLAAAENGLRMKYEKEDVEEGKNIAANEDEEDEDENGNENKNENEDDNENINEDENGDELWMKMS